METLQQNAHLTKEVILQDVTRILENMVGDWEMGFSEPIGPETRLAADLSFESIDVVHLAVELEEHYQRRNLPFQELIITPDGNYVSDVLVAELVDFLHTTLRTG